MRIAIAAAMLLGVPAAAQTTGAQFTAEAKTQVLYRHNPADRAHAVASAATAQGGTAPVPPRAAPPVVGSFDPRPVPQLTPTLEMTQAQVARLLADVSQLRKELAQTRADLARLRTEYDGTRQYTVLIGNKANALDTTFRKHTHTYAQRDINFTTKWFVTSGRPIAKDEKTDYATVITGTPSHAARTSTPDPAQ
jgi:hypothetical protein